MTMRRRIAVAFAIVTVTASCSSHVSLPVSAQVAVEIGTSMDSIPTVVAGSTIKSWSLFLICEPDWILRRDVDRLWQLYWHFLDLGQALGPEHAAVWFWAREPGQPGQGQIHTAIDAVRSRAFCSRLELAPSDGPFLLVTTDYPGPGFVAEMDSSINVLENAAIVSLHEMDPVEIETVMREIVDGVYSGDLSSMDRSTEGFWRSWQTVFESVQAGVSGAASRLRITIKTVFFDIEIS